MNRSQISATFLIVMTIVFSNNPSKTLLACWVATLIMFAISAWSKE